VRALRRPRPVHDDYLRHVERLVGRRRFAVQGVEGSSCRAAMWYSVGLTLHGLPELVVVGAPGGDGAVLVDMWASYVLDERVVLPGERLDWRVLRRAPTRSARRATAPLGTHLEV